MHNILQSQDFQDALGVAPNSAPNRPPEDTANDDLRGPEGIPDAETIIRAVRRMSDAERGKLLTALLGLADRPW